jgi:hypothetical protein
MAGHPALSTMAREHTPLPRPGGYFCARNPDRGSLRATKRALTRLRVMHTAPLWPASGFTLRLRAAGKIQRPVARGAKRGHGQV